jgi:DNA-binding NarL/FixJ family response regulator
MRNETSDVRILIYTGTTNRDLILAALQAEPQGFVHKSESLVTLVQGISLVAQNTTYFSPFATNLRIQKHRESQNIAQLLPRERTVLRLIGQGNSLKEVAGQMSLSTKTIETYRKSVMRKLNLKSVAAIVAYAIQCGLVQL